MPKIDDITKCPELPIVLKSNNNIPIISGKYMIENYLLGISKSLGRITYGQKFHRLVGQYAGHAVQK